MLRFPLGFLEDKTIYPLAQAVAGLCCRCRLGQKKTCGGVREANIKAPAPLNYRPEGSIPLLCCGFAFTLLPLVREQGGEAPYNYI